MSTYLVFVPAAALSKSLSPMKVSLNDSSEWTTPSIFFTQNLCLAAKNFSLFQIFLKLKNVISSSFTFFLYFKSNRFESLIVQKLTSNKINLSQVEATFLIFYFFPSNFFSLQVKNSSRGTKKFFHFVKEIRF